MPNNNKILINSIFNLPTPTSINYNWNIGSLLGITLIIQIISGILISFHYLSSVNEAFESVVHITRDVNNGWLVRRIHINGASLFFVLIYLHIGKNIFNSSFLIKITWNSGIVIIIILIATAFLGYVLPWGQISFWAATVITNLLSAIPIWGNEIVKWLWGGFSVRSPTLTRFFSLHFLLPFIIALFAIIHIISLHTTGSSNPINIPINKDKIQFYPFFSNKDIIGVIVSLLIYFLILLINPYISRDPENFIPSNPIITPIHIQPEWYFLFAYAILRRIPNKLGGVIALFISILILIVKPFQINNKKFSSKFNPWKKLVIYSFYFNFIILTWIGIKTIETPFYEIGIIFRLTYFILIILI